MALTQKQESGINLEKPVSWFLEQKMKFGERVDHNRFDDSYPLDNHNVVDIVVKGKALIECTNPKETTWMTDEIMGKKLDYFHRTDPQHWLIWFLVVSFANFSQAIMDRIKRLKIHIVILGFHSDKNNFWKVIQTLFHSTIYRLLSSKPKPQPPTSIPVSIHQTRLSVIDYAASSQETNNLHQHRGQVVRPVIPITHPCQVGHPDHERWLEHQYELMEKASCQG
jgi:hypothetical protein